MKAAHEGVPVAGLPLGAWRNAEAPNPDAPPAPPLDLTGAQAPMALPGGRGGAQPPGSAPIAAPPPSGGRSAPGAAEIEAPIPPAPIPNSGPAARDKGPPNKLLGTL